MDVQEKIKKTQEDLTTRKERRSLRLKGPSISRKSSKKESTEGNSCTVDKEELDREKLRFSSIVIDFLFMFKSNRFKFILKYTSLFLLSGFLYKIWIWFTACVLMWYNAPCDPDHGLFTMPFIFYSMISDDEYESPYFFSFFDWGHFALSVFSFLMICSILLGIQWSFIFLRFLWNKTKNKLSSYIVGVKTRTIQRRNEFRKNTQKKKDD